MNPRPDAPTGYDWEAPASPTVTPGLPDHAAGDLPRDVPPPPTRPSDTDGSANVSPGPAPRQGFPAWATVAIVLGAIAGIVTLVVALVYGATSFLARQVDPFAIAGYEEDPYDDGVVTDTDGGVLEDGTGQYDDPATVGEHTFTWPTWDGGTVTYAATSVDPDAVLPRAGEVDVLQDGFRLVVIEVDLTYVGEGSYTPDEDLWVTAEGVTGYYNDVAEGLLPVPVTAVESLSDGETATFQSAFIVSDGEYHSLRIGLETGSGYPLYYTV